MQVKLDISSMSMLSSDVWPMYQVYKALCFYWPLLTHFTFCCYEVWRTELPFSLPAGDCHVRYCLQSPFLDDALSNNGCEHHRSGYSYERQAKEQIFFPGSSMCDHTLIVHGGPRERLALSLRCHQCMRCREVLEHGQRHIIGSTECQVVGLLWKILGNWHLKNLPVLSWLERFQGFK